MSLRLATLSFTSAADVAAARLQVRRAAELLGFDRPAQTRLATAASEIARNASDHAGGGVLSLAVDQPVGPRQFLVVIEDRGGGIGELDAILAGRKAFAPNHGQGLLNARRLVDGFDIRTGLDGTRVQLSQALPASAQARLNPVVLDEIAAAMPQRRADPVTALHEQNRELAESLHQLGERQADSLRLNRELEETNRGVVALYAELEEKAEQLKAASDTKSRFLSQMSHEFRTPLNSILALSRLLIDGVDGPLNAEQTRQVGYIRSSAQTLLEMVNDLLDLSKIEAGKLDVKPAAFTATELFASLRGALRPLHQNPAVRLVFDEPTGLPALFGDEPKVAQVLRNLIHNALKFTEQGQVRVTARHDSARRRMVFSVADTGVGISAEDQARIFEEFSQVDGRLQRGGTGLGLPLSRRLAMLMGGDITLRSQPGEGSTFELFLPVRLGQPLQPSPSAAGHAARRMLVIDDEEAFRYVVRHIAQDADFEVMEAADGQAGLEAALQHRPELIMLDLHMPRMDGFTVMRRLAESGLRTTPVVICSSYPLSMEQKRSLSSAYAILPKQDVSRDGLTSLINTAVFGPGGVP
ncbi:MAG TPA: ATP-binding protein [Ideonella sp.]|uniref:ATP-binding protein n=1 Tax=Ideonella sp. TaxID=1929293 RepID=UPI002CE7AAB5|nr:ATP-binding protein [Ideonella sp.]HSI49838.1 ATP-binding protein [Ideonella sp.]